MPSTIDNFKRDFIAAHNKLRTNFQVFNTAFLVLLRNYKDDFHKENINIKDIFFEVKDKDHINFKNLTVLHIAIMNGNVEAVRMLVDHEDEHIKIPRNITHSSTNNCLHFTGFYSKPATNTDEITFNNNLIEIAKILSDPTKLDYLALDLNEAKAKGQLHQDGGTFAHSIACGGSLALMRFLISQQKNGDDVAKTKAVFEVQRNDKKTPLDFAKNRHPHFESYYSQIIAQPHSHLGSHKHQRQSELSLQETGSQPKYQRTNSQLQNLPANNLFFQLPRVEDQPVTQKNPIVVENSLPPPSVLAGEKVEVTIDLVPVKIEPGTEEKDEQEVGQRSKSPAQYTRQ